jgi:hypothetical protein
VDDRLTLKLRGTTGEASSTNFWAIFRKNTIIHPLSTDRKLHMDTDDLSEETYKEIIIEAGKFNSNLALQFRLIASYCKTEKEYLMQSERLVKEIKTADKSMLCDMFFGSPPDNRKLHLTLDKILANISEIRRITGNKR